MDDTTRDLIHRLGSELAGIMEGASLTAAMLPGVTADELSNTIAELGRNAQQIGALTNAIRALVDRSDD